MPQSEHLERLKRDIDSWNQWREENLGVLPDLSWADLSKMDLSEANLIVADLSHADLREVNLSHGDLRQANLTGTDLSGADLFRANISDTEMIEADLSRADLREANLSGADLRWANLRGAELSGANFDRVKFRKVDLSGAYLFQANFVGADLRDADLNDVNLLKANLSGADLSGANLCGANLSEANLSGAQLDGADLMFTNFTRTTLTKANFKRAKLFRTIFADVNLSEAIHLESVEHCFPSTVGVDTFFQSKGKIPDAFLRGAGVPENLIVYKNPLTHDANHYYSCYISHSDKDKDFSEMLLLALRKEGIRAWRFPEEIKMTESIRCEIGRSIDRRDILLFICSEESLTSAWAMEEIEHALMREETENIQILFPVTIDPFLEYWQAPLQKDLLNRIIVNFSGWSQNSQILYQRIPRLISALKKKKNSF